MHLFSVSLLLASVQFHAAHPSQELQGHVLVVGGSGGYSQVQVAVDAATDGDTILVKGGSYDGFVIDGRKLSVVADAGASVSITGTVHVDNVGASQWVLLQGLQIRPATPHFVIAFRAQNDSGSLRIEECNISGEYPSCTDPGGHAVWLDGDSDVSFTRCSLQGGTFDVQCTGGQPGANAITSRSSVVTLYDCTLRGGPGGKGRDSNYGSGGRGGYGGSGYWSTYGFLFSSGSVIEGGGGGQGGDGCANDCAFPTTFPGDGGDGGDAVHVTGGAVDATIVADMDTVLVPGPAGSGGDDVCGCDYSGEWGVDGSDLQAPVGSVRPIPGITRRLVAPRAPRENTTATLRFYGQPGDSAWLLVASTPRFSFSAPFHGPSLTEFSPQVRLIQVGTIPPSGGLAFDFVLPSLGLESKPFFFQSLFRDTSSQRFFGAPATIVELGSGF